MKNKKNKLDNVMLKKILHVLGLTSMGLSMVCLVAIVFFNINFGKNIFIDSWAYKMNLGWEAKTSDGTFVTVDLPASIDLEVGENLEIKNKLPEDLHNGAYFTFLTAKDSVVYIDGEERARYSKSSNDLPGGIVDNQVIQVKLYPDDAGKEIKIVKNDPNTWNGRVRDFIIGNSFGTFKLMVKEYGIKVLLAVMLLLISIFTYCLGWTMHKNYKTGKEIVLLSSAVMCLSLWVIMDSYLYVFIFSRGYINFVLGYMLVMIIPLPLMFYMNRIQKGRYAVAYIPMAIISIVSTIIFSVLHFAGIRDFEDNIELIDAVVLLAAIVAIVTIILDLVKKQAAENKLVYLGFAALGTCGAIDVILINRPLKESTVFDGVFIVLGTYLLLGSALANSIKLLQEIQISAARTAKESELKSSFLANMSHEIRTPVGAVMGMNELILREELPDNVREYAENIRSASNNLLEVINDILDFSKIESGKLEIICQNYDISKMLNDVINIIKVKIEEKGLKFKVYIASELPSVLYGDETRIRQCMINVLNNAVKYTPVGEIGLDITGEQTDKGFALKIVISDTGIGIKEEDKAKLFDKFVRLDEKANSKVEGSGLGLTITESFVKLMDGEISVESEYGKGSTFTLILPQKVVDEKPVGDIVSKMRQDRNKKRYEPSFVANGVDVLVVDDNQMNLKVVSGLLKKTNVTATTAMSGEQALGLVRDKKFDMIFLDHMMPEMDGIETLARMKKLHDNKNNTTPVIALTANAIKGAREEYISAGFDDYMSKPIAPEALEKIIIKYVDSSKIGNI